MEILKAVFGIVLVNKFRIIMGEGKRHAFTKIAKLFTEGWKREYAKADGYVKAYLVLAPLLNVFVFEWLISFVLVVASNVYYVRKVMNSQ